MGVLACERRGCPNILCHRLILEDQCRICDECWEEMLQYKSRWRLSRMSAREVRALLEEFMDTEVGAHRMLADEAEIDEEFDKLTRQRSR